MNCSLNERCGLVFVALLAWGCSAHPPATVATGERIEHSSASFSVVRPEGWTAQPTDVGWNLVRDLPYASGHPSISFRELPESAAASYSIGGEVVVEGDMRMEYRFSPWRNARGGGHTLEVLLSAPQRGAVLVDASVWDSLPTPDFSFFNEQMWPVIRSVRLSAPKKDSPPTPSSSP